jgi:putative transposase
MYPLVRDLVVGEARIRVPAAMTCRLLRFFLHPGLIAWLKKPFTGLDWSDGHQTELSRLVASAEPSLPATVCIYLAISA